MLFREGQPYVLSPRQSCAAMCKVLSKLAGAKRQNLHRVPSLSPRTAAKPRLHEVGKQSTSGVARCRLPSYSLSNSIECRVTLRPSISLDSSVLTAMG